MKLISKWFKIIMQHMCGYFYHRFNYSSNECVRCGMNIEDVSAKHGYYVSDRYKNKESTK